MHSRIAKGLSSRFLEKLHDIGVENTTLDTEALESSSLSQGLKLLLCSLFPTRVMGQHDHINMNNSLSGKAGVRGHRKNGFSNNYFAIIRKRGITVLQEFQAVFITPIMANPLQNQLINTYCMNQQSNNKIFSIVFLMLYLVSRVFQMKRGKRE